MSQYSKEFILFVSTIAGEAANSSRASWKAIAHVIMNRFKYKEWRKYQTIKDIILKTGFDAVKEKNQPFLNVYNSLSTGNPSSLALQIIAAVKPIYDGIIKDPTGKVVLYYSPKTQLYLSQKMPHKYKRVPSRWDFNLLEEVKISGTENDDFKWYRYKNANRSKRLQIVNLDGQAIPDVPYEITHNKQGQEKVIVQGKTDQEGKTKEIPYQHAGKDVTIKINQSAGKRMPKANIQGMLLVTEIITKLISPYLKQRVILKPDGKPGNYAGKYHKVKKGETLTKIAQKLGTTVEALLHANPKITDPNKIYIGQKIRLPAKTGRPVARKEDGEVKIDRPKARETNTQPPAEKVQTKSTVNTEANTQTKRENGEKQTPPQPRQKKEVNRVNSVDGKPVTVVKQGGQELPWIKIARQEIGVKEIRGKVHNKRVIEYHSTTGKAPDDETAWCSSFVNWSLKQVGIKGTNNAQAISWQIMHWGVALSTPVYGCIGVRRKPNGINGHVAFIVGKTKDGNLIALGGNQGDEVNLQEFPKGYFRYFRYPKNFDEYIELPVLTSGFKKIEKKKRTKTT
jgi:TIGR02594 family protein